MNKFEELESFVAVVDNQSLLTIKALVLLPINWG